LRYKKLSKPAREKVWTAFLQRSGTSRIKPDEIEKLTEQDINGRQVSSRQTIGIEFILIEVGI
jgi:hypothetical protein